MECQEMKQSIGLASGGVTTNNICSILMVCVCVCVCVCVWLIRLLNFAQYTWVFPWFDLSKLGQIELIKQNLIGTRNRNLTNSS